MKTLTCAFAFPICAVHMLMRLTVAVKTPFPIMHQCIQRIANFKHLILASV